MKLNYNSPTPFLPSSKFYLNVLGSSYLRYLLKSLVRSINFNFFFYLIDESLVPPSVKLTPKLAESRLAQLFKSSNKTRACFKPLNSSRIANVLLKYNINYKANKHFPALKDNYRPSAIRSVVHPSSKWLMSSLLTTTSYALLGIAKSKHKVTKSNSKMIELLKSNRLKKKLCRPLTIKHRSKPMQPFKYRKLLLFKNFISLSLPTTTGSFNAPLYKSIKFRRRSRSFKSRNSPYFFLDWNRAPKVSISRRIASIWTRFKSLNRFNVSTSKLSSSLTPLSDVRLKKKMFKGSIRKWLISKAKRGKKVWPRRVRRLVLKLRLNKRFWAFRLNTAKTKFTLKSKSNSDLSSLIWGTVKKNSTSSYEHIRSTSSYPKFPRKKLPIRLNRRLIRTHSNFLPASEIKRRLRKPLKSLSSQALITKLSGLALPFRGRVTEIKINRRVRKPVTVLYPVSHSPLSPNRRIKSRSNFLRRRFYAHSSFVRLFRVFKKKGHRIPRRFRRLVIRKSKRLLSSKWSKFRFRLFRTVILKRTSVLNLSNVQKPDFGLLINSYKSLATSLNLKTFSSPLRKLFSTRPQPSFYLPMVITAMRANHLRTNLLSNPNKKPVIKFYPSSSLLFTSSPFFFLNYITALPRGLSDSIRSSKSVPKTRNFTVFPDSDAIKALFFRYINRQKSLAQSRKSFYRAFLKRRSYRSTKLLKSNIHLSYLNNNDNVYSNKLAKTSVRTTKWVRLKRLHLLPRRVKNSAINRIRRIRFKPGYGRIWRSARVSVKDILGIQVKYQYRLTPILQKQYLYSRNEKIEHLSFTLGYALLSAKFAHDTWVLNSLISNNNVYLNGTVCSNDKIRIFTNDFIQLLINLKYYISLRWLKNWTFRKRNKISKIFYKKIRPGITRGVTKTPKLSRNLPNYFFNLKYCYSDVPRCFEVDYFSLSLFVIHDQLRFERYLPRQQFRINYFTLNMYNWKYIT